MDEALRQKLLAWVAFYRDLGIEDFYRRPAEVRSSKVVTRDLVPEILSSSFSVPGSEVSAVRFFEAPNLGSVGPSSSLPGPPAQSLHLFEAPAPPSARRELETLEQIREDLGECHRCQLAAGRKTTRSRGKRLGRNRSRRPDRGEPDPLSVGRRTAARSATGNLPALH